MPFADLLQWVAQSRKTGTLLIQGSEFTKKIYFDDGAVVAVASDNPREFLGYYLVGWAFIAEEELQELLDMQSRYGTLLGELLVIVGRLSRDELTYVLEVKTEETIFELFFWSEGEFRFLEKVLPENKFQPTDLAVDTIILEGIRRRDERAVIGKVIPKSSWVPKLVRAVDVQQVDEAELAILREINGRNSIEEIALGCRLGVFPVLEYIYHGTQAGLFEVVPPASESGDIPGYSKGAWRLVLRKAEAQLAEGNLKDCYAQLQKLKGQLASDHEGQAQIVHLEKQILSQLQADGIGATTVLELAIPMSELTNLSCSPEEGFLLSRVNGIYSLAEICKMMPGSPLDVYLVIDAMLRRNVLRLKQPA